MKHALTGVRYIAGGALLISAWGWLELLRSLPLPGPRLGAALPLHEGAKASALPLGIVVGVWFALALAVSLLFRPRRHIAAAALLALAAFATATTGEGIQLEITRQGLFGVDTLGALTTSVPWIAGAVWLLVSLAVWTPAGEIGSNELRLDRATPRAGGAAREPLSDSDRQTAGVASASGSWTR